MNGTEQPVTVAVALLKDMLGATEIPPDYCRKCGRDYQPDGTCPKCASQTRRNTA